MNLDDINEINKLDKKQVAASIEKLPAQVEQAWQEASQINFPDNYKGVKNILVDGMGGSSLGPELIFYLYKGSLKIPYLLVRDYDLPAFVNEETLVVLSSYSGTTEEVLSLGKQALEKGFNLTGITEGRQLGEFLRTNNLPGYIFDAKLNPSGQPRLGLGYSVAGILAMFKSLGFLNIEEKEMQDVLFCVREISSKLAPSSPTADNFAKEIAAKLRGVSVGVVGAEHLSANAHIFANQINENSKTFSTYYLLSELNHHLLEGLSRPENLGQNLKFLILDSDLYSGKIKKRVSITQEVIEKQKVETISIKLESETPLVQAFEAILVSSWVSFYLGILNGFDPSEIPWVDYFKEQLSK